LAGPTTPTYDSNRDQSNESITTAIDNADDRQRALATSALDDAAAIIWTNAITALIDPVDLSASAQCPVHRIRRVNPNDKATPSSPDTTTSDHMPPAILAIQQWRSGLPESAADRII